MAADFLFFLSGNLFQAEPFTIPPAVIDQLGVIATDTLQDFSPLLHIPLEQKFCFSLFLRAFHLPQDPMRFFAHGSSLPLKD
jgi:hypothetical protein